MRFRSLGFTLLELMIAIALMLVVMLMLRTMFVSAQNAYVTASRRVQVYQQARVALDMIEQDLMRMRTTSDDDSLQLRSLTLSDFRSREAPVNERIYSSLDDWAKPQDEKTPGIREFLSFVGRATWFEPESQQYRSGDCTIVYYLRMRHFEGGGDDRTGAYLVRRVLPLRTLAEIVQLNSPGGADQIPDIEPHEDEIASFVFASRVYVDDSAAFQMDVFENGSSRSILPETVINSPNHWLWVDPASAGTPPPPTPRKNNKAVILQTPVKSNLVQFGGIWSTQVNPDRKWVSTRASFPAVVAVELTFIDRSFERPEDDTAFGTYRTFTRAIQLPSAGISRRIDDLDKEIIRSGGRGP